MKLNVDLCVEYLGMPAEHWTLAAQAAEWIETDALAKELTLTALEALSCGKDDIAADACREIKAYTARMNPALEEGVVPMIFALALPRTLAARRAEGMPEDILRDTVSDYATWARSYEKQFGKVGFGEFYWEVGFHSGKLTKLGRLQFETATFHAPYTIYRHKTTGDILPVPHAGAGVDENGCLVYSNPPAFKTELTVQNGVLRCNRVDTRLARIRREMVEYDLSDLEPILTKGARVLHMHIPETGPLKDEEVAASLAQAKAYYAAKGFPCRVAACESWLLDSALQTYGVGCGNILSFQNRFSLFSWPTDGSEAVSRVFGRGTDASDPDALPENSRLQRGLKAYLKTGKPLRDSGGILFL